MTVTLPHFDTSDGGFTLDATGKPMVCEQDSAEDVASCIVNILDCPKGGKLDDPNFGIPWPLFQNMPLQVQPIFDAIAAYETRAALSATTSPDGSTIDATLGQDTATITIEAASRVSTNL